MLGFGEDWPSPSIPSRLLLQYSEQVFLADELKLLAVEFDFRSAVLGQKHSVAGLNVERQFLAVLVGLLADREEKP